MKMMECKDVISNLSCHIDGDGSAELRKAIEEHIVRCRRCRVILDTTKRTLRIVADAEPFEVPLAVSARLYTRLEKMLSEDLPVQ
jgi:anti-sigma factor RsiW